MLKTLFHARRPGRAFSVAVATLALFAGSPGSSALGLLFDFGADGTQTQGGTTGAPAYWNNLAGEGTSDFGILFNLVTTDGNLTDISLEMISRFNGANESGTTANPDYPASATRDSLFGNTELFGDLENVTPIFALTGLDPAATYTLTFYASRLGVGDNRETRYTVTGSSEAFVDLNVANNVTNSVKVSAARPDSVGQLVISLTPGPNNNNANHFTYLGILKIESSTGQTLFVDAGAGGSPTDMVEPPASTSWNNVTATLGADPTGLLQALVTTNGTVTDIALQMVSRFNGANANGTTAATRYPVTATQDSLFGNTEAFSGLSNVMPVFKLTGLDPNSNYAFTFYASRTGVSDNRETRYTVTGQNESSADLNTAANVTNTVSVTGIRPTASGEIQIALTPGPNNNNGNHFTYLGVMQVDSTPIRTPRVLVDLGAVGRPTTSSSDPENAWNNITTDVGSTDTGALTNLVKTDGTGSGITFQMISRFNGANENGTEFSGLYPLDATRDSLFGNTESFSGLENVTPIFKLTGLRPGTAYNLILYASRLGVGDNRETRYTVTGAAETSADLNVANNETEFVTISDVLPNGTGEIQIALSPGPNNDNGNHFVYLGVLQLDWEAPVVSVQPELSEPAYSNGKFSFRLKGTAGKTYAIRRTRNFTMWETAQTVPLTSDSQVVQITQPEAYYFYQALEQ